MGPGFKITVLCAFIVFKWCIFFGPHASISLVLSRFCRKHFSIIFFDFADRTIAFGYQYSFSILFLKRDSTSG